MMYKVNKIINIYVIAKQLKLENYYFIKLSYKNKYFIQSYFFSNSLIKVSRAVNI